MTKVLQNPNGLVTKTVVVELGQTEHVRQRLIDGGNAEDNSHLTFSCASRATAGSRLASNLTASPLPREAILQSAQPLLRKFGDGLLDLYPVQRFAPTEVSGFFPRGFLASSPCSAT